MKIFANEEIGKIKALHGVNCAPYVKTLGNNQSYIDELFGYIGTPYSRLHDCCGSYGGCYFVDVPNIFRDFSADENDEKSYDFYYTDEYITAIINAGTKIVYRLGITIEWGSKKYRANPPEDFGKWARICEHIIMHYNKGWASGFHYNIKYWEIWNEPENPPMWTGTKEQFFELYKTASIYLKEKFPDIKVGGYGSCGFYAAFRPNQPEFQKSFLVWFDDFLKMCKENGCPLDFYTWHIYTPNVGEIISSAEYVKGKLSEYGFDKTESHLNEWNYGAEGGGFDNKANLVGAGFISRALIALQNFDFVNMANYYVASITSSYNGLMDIRTDEYTPVTHVFWAFNKLYRAGIQIKVNSSFREPDVIAAKSKDGKIYALISNYKKVPCSSVLEIEGSKTETVKIFRLEEKAGFKFVREVSPVEKERFYFEPNGVYFLEA